MITLNSEPVEQRKHTAVPIQPALMSMFLVISCGFPQVCHVALETRPTTGECAASEFGRSCSRSDKPGNGHVTSLSQIPELFSPSVHLLLAVKIG